MDLTNEQLKQFLVDAGQLDLNLFTTAVQEAEKANKPLSEILLKQGLLSYEQLIKIWGETVGVPYIDPTKEMINKDILFLIPEAISKKYQVVAFGREGGSLLVAMVDPLDLQTIEFVKKKIGEELKVFVATEDAIRKVQGQYRKGLQVEFNEIIEQSLTAAREEEDLKKMAENLPFIKIVDTVVEHAVLAGASDIHIEPLEKKVLVRFRIDGILHDMIVLPKEILSGVLARIKILSNMKLDEHRLPQDGRFKIEKEGQKISFRVSLLPVFDGEKVVIRLLNESTQIFTLEQLGLQHTALEAVKAGLGRPHGMILVTGPTGSGKTTTLYSMMNMLNVPGVNISTVEDPIEYRMPRINQSQIRPKIGFTFATGLRSLLRQDPNIIMVGEIRDTETVEMAIHSALTGHLVLSTLHTNDAAGSLPRLIDMGAKPFLVASTVNVVIAQRLVRKICTNCMEKYTLGKEALTKLGKDFDLERLIQILKREKIIEQDKAVEEFSFYRGKGCERCNFEGYKGRIGIYEVLMMTEELKQMVIKESSSEQLIHKALEQGMITMHEDGFIKALTGVTTLEEILSVTSRD